MYCPALQEYIEKRMVENYLKEDFIFFFAKCNFCCLSPAADIRATYKLITSLQQTFQRTGFLLSGFYQTAKTIFAGQPFDLQETKSCARNVYGYCEPLKRRKKKKKNFFKTN